MQHHFKGRTGFIVTVIIASLLVSVIGLWSWNTLAGLFDWPTAQYKHAIAALFFILILRFGLFHKHGRRHRHRLTHR